MAREISASERRRALTLGSLGGGLEFYDFVIYAVFADVIGQTFFPSGDATANLLAAFTVFAIGYLARPLGGILFSHYGDRLGRRNMLRLSIGGMAGATILMGLMPGYDNIGIAASVIFVGLRIVQGMSLGGEIPGALVLITETMPRHRGLACGVLFMMINVGLLVAHAVQWGIVAALPAEDVSAFGWRIGFLLGGAIALAGFLLRVRLSESPAFEEMEAATHKVPLAMLFARHGRQVLAGFLIAGIGASIVSLLYLYLDTYLTRILGYPGPAMASASVLGILMFSLPMPLAGWLGDRLGLKLPTLAGGLALIVAVVPAYVWMAGDAASVLPALALLSILASFAWGAAPAPLTAIFPTAVRYSGVAVSYNLGFAIIGGLTPLAATALIRWSGDSQMPAYLLILFTVLGLAALAAVRLLPPEDRAAQG
ncbi:MFS transporter [Marinibaculum pumilum]|uniref:MFS transporter n=1 Tax=Marinibaculum pumilum TaxID=1766165 RepID=A0ABV7KUX2_9PROT